MRESLYEHAGGDPAFLALAEAHHARCLADPELNHPFSHADQNPDHVPHLAAYWAEVMGGPATYSQRYGNQALIMSIHSGHGDMTDLGERFVRAFVGAADDAGLPDDAEFRAALRDYMVWAVDEIIGFSRHQAVQAAPAPMPRWSWDGLQPPSD
jgi:hemoglobin